MAHPIAADFEFHRAETFWATSFIACALFVDVNSHVNAAAVELDADELSRFLLCWRNRLLWNFRLWIFRWRITGNVEHDTGPFCHG